MKTPVWLSQRDALSLHDRLLALHRGAEVLRDEGLLQSALARPEQHFANAESPDVFEMAALYTAGVVQNHPFLDGNKSTGFILGILFLELKGHRFSATEEDAARAVLEVAAGNMDASGYAAFLRGNSKKSKTSRRA